MVIGSVESGRELSGKKVCKVEKVAWRKGQVGWVLGGFGGSVLVMGEWSVGQWIVPVMSFQKMLSLPINCSMKLIQLCQQTCFTSCSPRIR